MPQDLSAARVVRGGFAAAAIVLGAAGLVTGEPRVIAAGGAFGIMWTAWDLLMSYVVQPLWDLAIDMLQGGGGLNRAPPNLRPTLDETIAYLESHIARDTTRELDVQSALRLEEIYRVIKKDPARARAVLERVLERYPGDAMLGERMRGYLEE